MSAYVDEIHIARARGYAVWGAVFCLLTVILAPIVVQIGTGHLSFLFLPIIAIFLWPTQAATGTSSICLFFLGLVFDSLTGGPLGFWAFVFLLSFGVGRLRERASDEAFLSIWARFCLWLLVVVGAILALNVLSNRPLGLLPLIVSALGTLCVFPFAFSARQIMRPIILGEDAGYPA